MAGLFRSLFFTQRRANCSDGRRMNNSLLLFLGTILISLPIHSEAAPYAIATRDIHLNGYNLSVDSFNSTDPLRSTGASMIH
jgi:hypothetical protein